MVWGGDGGRANIDPAKIESFDVFSEAWDLTQQLRCPLPDSLRSIAATTDGKSAFFFGGSTPGSEGFTYSNTLYQVNLSTLQCRELVPKTPFRAPKAGGSCMIFFDQKLVVYGGYTGKGRCDKVYVFNMRTSELI